jgi:hypothetical protein
MSLKTHGIFFGDVADTIYDVHLFRFLYAEYPTIRLKSYPTQTSSELDILPLEINDESEKGRIRAAMMSATEARHFHLCRQSLIFNDGVKNSFPP